MPGTSGTGSSAEDDAGHAPQVDMQVSFTADSMTMAMEMGGQKTAQYTVKSASGATTVITTTKDGQVKRLLWLWRAMN